MLLRHEGKRWLPRRLSWYDKCPAVHLLHVRALRTLLPRSPLAVLRHWDAKAVDEAVRRSRKGLIVGYGHGSGPGGDMSSALDLTDNLGDELFCKDSSGNIALNDPEVGSEQMRCREYARMAIYKLMLAL